MEKEEQILKKRFMELARLSYERDIPVHTDFLSLHEQTIFQSLCGTLPPVRVELTGGFLTSERKVACFLASYEENFAELPFDCIRLDPAAAKFAEALTHRDYLGAVMSLGIERGMIGDIVLKGQTAYIFVLKKMTRYLLDNLSMIRHTKVCASLCGDFAETLSPEFEEQSGTVSSLRLDSLTALAAHVSRTRAAELIRAEKVSLNGRIETSCARGLAEGDIFSVRGVGKFRLKKAEGQTKRGRTIVTLLQYI
ncbi:MAG: RNA-binding protein [Lachnospiraceae bacterium]|nr:RNA-binding protein [Lachnospiraceae bacterium]